MITALTPEEAARWLDAAPDAVQAAVLDDATAKTVGTIAAAQAFHVDQTGLLVNLVSYLLVGYVSPQQAENALVEAGVHASVARAVLTEVNQKIFVPLQARMRAGAAAAPARPSVPLPRYQPPPASPHPSHKASEGTANATQGMAHLPPRAASAPVPQAPRAPWQAPLRPPVRFNEPQPVASHAPITNPERELPLGESSVPTPPAPAPAHEPIPSPARVPVPAAMHAPLPPVPSVSSAPLPPRSVLPSAASRPGVTPRPVMPPAPAHEATIAPGAPVPWRVKTAAPPENLPGTGAATPSASGASSADPYREPIE